MIITNVITIKDNVVIDVESFLTFDFESNESKKETKEEINKAFKETAIGLGAIPEEINDSTDYYYNDKGLAVHKVSTLICNEDEKDSNTGMEDGS